MTWLSIIFKFLRKFTIFQEVLSNRDVCLFVEQTLLYLIKQIQIFPETHICPRTFQSIIFFISSTFQMFHPDYKRRFGGNFHRSYDTLVIQYSTIRTTSNNISIIYNIYFHDITAAANMYHSVVSLFII